MIIKVLEDFYIKVLAPMDGFAGCRHVDMLLLLNCSFDGYGMPTDMQNMIIPRSP
jgi:hypothetical protein